MVAISDFPTAYSQVSWPGVADIDDCWVIVPFWCLVASRSCTKAQLPTVARFRNKAGVPELSTPNGGSNADAIKAVKTLFPDSGAVKYDGSPATFIARVKAGMVASLSVRSSALPASMQFGFKGSHQVAIVYADGKFWLMNPLQKMGTDLRLVTEQQVVVAAKALLGDGKVHAVLFPYHAPAKPEPAPDPHLAEIAALRAKIAAMEAERTNLILTARREEYDRVRNGTTFPVRP